MLMFITRGMMCHAGLSLTLPIARLGLFPLQFLETTTNSKIPEESARLSKEMAPR